MSKYVIHPGEFTCHTCKKNVKTLRHYPKDKLLTWMCEDKHLSSVNLETKRSKKDYDGKI